MTRVTPQCPGKHVTIAAAFLTLIECFLFFPNVTKLPQLQRCREATKSRRSRIDVPLPANHSRVANASVAALSTSQ